MNEKRLRELAVKSLVLLLGTMLLSYGIGTVSLANGWTDAAEAVSDEELTAEGRRYKNLESGERTDRLTEPYLILKKPEAKKYEVSLEDLYMEHGFRFLIRGLEEKVFTKENLSADREENTCIKKMSLCYKEIEETSSYTAVYEVELDGLYAYQLYEDKEAIYIELWEPSRLYEQILVIDAGHGGNDIGTYSSDMKYYEKDINLSITRQLKKLLDKEKIKVYYTRLSDEKVYLNPRVDLANELKADFFISIHCNSGDNPAAKGCEVLYGTKLKKGKELARLCLKSMTEEGSLLDRGLVKKDDIYILEKSQVPTALIEVGFMSNEEEFLFLTEEKNQEKIAEYIYQAVMEAFSQLEE